MGTFKLEMALDALVAGVFTLSSGLDGPDVLADLGAFAGTYNDITKDVTGEIRVVTGTDNLAGQVQASALTVDVTRSEDPSYWNPNNPDSPLFLVTPGFVPMRPARLTEYSNDLTAYSIFYGFLRRAPWRISTRSCQLYFEDLLFRISRVWPTIAATGPTTTGAAIGLVLDAAGWPWAEWRSLATGDAIDDFSADGSKTAVQLISELIEAERGTVFIRGDGVFVYESRDMPQSRVALWHLDSSTNIDELESGIDADSIFTRATVTRTDPAEVLPDVTSTWIDDTAEREFGRADVPEIRSPYIPSAGVVPLSQDLVYAGTHGAPPVTANAFAIDDATLKKILSTPLQSVLAIDDALGGTTGDFLVQRIVHTYSTGQRRAVYTLTKRAQRSFALDSALDGPDIFRY